MVRAHRKRRLEQLLRGYLEAFCAFVTRVLTVLPRVSCQEEGKPLSGFRVEYQ